ncbi:MAG: ATP-binding protein [Verrucomicrobia bacterium]|nr:ATP-binding protein [Verrucomicrobiota bacterium]
MRALAPTVSAYVDFLLATPGHLRHQTLRRLWALSQRMSPELFVRAVERAHRYRLPELKTLERLAHLVGRPRPASSPCRPLMSPFATVLPTRTARSPKPPTSPPTMTDELQPNCVPCACPAWPSTGTRTSKRPPASGCPMPPCSLTSWKRSTVSRATAPGSSACGAPVCPSPDDRNLPFDRQPKLNRKAIFALYDTLDFLAKAQNIIWLGRTGCGKTGLASSFLVGAIQRGATGRYVLFADLVAELYRRRPPRPGSGAPEVSALGPAPDR